MRVSQDEGHLVVAVIVPNDPLDALTWVLTAVGFAATAATLPLREAQRVMAP